MSGRRRSSSPPGSEPGDAVVGRLTWRLGAVEKVRLLATSTSPSGADAAEIGSWRQRVGVKLSAGIGERGLEQTERLALRVILPGDVDWPEGPSVLGPRAPVVLWKQLALREQATAGRAAGFRMESRCPWGCRSRRRGRRSADQCVGGTNETTSYTPH